MNKLILKFKERFNCTFLILLIPLLAIAFFRPTVLEGSNQLEFLMDLFVILLSTKLLGILTKKVQIPAVVGALLAGVIFGPAILNNIHETEFLMTLSELGVIVIMFTAGLEVDIKELKKCGKSATFIAFLGVIIPLVAGGIFACFFNNNGSIMQMDYNQLLQNIFIGVILTATSVSLTVEALKEMGKLTSKVGNTILAAALIDDVMGIVVLTIITSMADSSVSIPIVLLKLLGFFVFAIVVGILANKAFKAWMTDSPKGLRRHIVLAFCLCLGMSYIAEVYFGVADITGAFIAGVILSNTPKSKYLDKRFDSLLYMLLAPVFFASIGLKVCLEGFDTGLIVFTIGLIIVAMLTKVIGCFIASKMCKFSNKESLQIGTGMIARGEVALIVANKGAAVGLMNPIYFGPLVIMVVFIAISTPILLKLTFHEKKKKVEIS